MEASKGKDKGKGVQLLPEAKGLGVVPEPKDVTPKAKDAAPKVKEVDPKSKEVDLKATDPLLSKSNRKDVPPLPKA